MMMNNPITIAMAKVTTVPTPATSKKWVET
jgi:hypothetical protein